MWFVTKESTISPCVYISQNMCYLRKSLSLDKNFRKYLLMQFVQEFAPVDLTSQQVRVVAQVD